MSDTTSSTRVARAVRKLEDGGFIRRITDTGNRRAVRLFLTEKGEHPIPLLQVINREWENETSAGLSKEEMAALHSPDAPGGTEWFYDPAEERRYLR